MTWKKILICCVLIVFGISENANALELTINDFDYIYSSSNHPYCRWNYSLVGASSTKIWGSYSTNNAPTLNSSNVESLNAVGCGTANESNMYLNVRTGDVMTLYVRQLQIYSNNYGGLTENQQAGELTGFTVQGTGDDEIDIVDFEQIGQLDNKGRRVTYWKFTGIVQMNTTNPNWGIKWYRNPSFQYEMIIDVMSMQLYRPKERLDYTNQLDDILEAINGISTSTEIEEGMKEAMEDEKDQIQDASDEGENAANEAGEQAEDDTATITEQMGSIFEAFETEATDCVIPLNLGHGVNAGNLNLCSEVPQTVRNLIGYVSTAIVALVVIRLLNTIINTYLQFIESFQR